MDSIFTARQGRPVQAAGGCARLAAAIPAGQGCQPARGRADHLCPCRRRSGDRQVTLDRRPSGLCRGAWSRDRWRQGPYRHRRGRCGGASRAPHHRLYRLMRIVDRSQHIHYGVRRTIGRPLRFADTPCDRGLCDACGRARRSGCCSSRSITMVPNWTVSAVSPLDSRRCTDPVPRGPCRHICQDGNIVSCIGMINLSVGMIRVAYRHRSARCGPDFCDIPWPPPCGPNICHRMPNGSDLGTSICNRSICLPGGKTFRHLMLHLDIA